MDATENRSRNRAFRSEALTMIVERILDEPCFAVGSSGGGFGRDDGMVVGGLFSTIQMERSRLTALKNR